MIVLSLVGSCMGYVSAYVGGDVTLNGRDNDGDACSLYAVNASNINITCFEPNDKTDHGLFIESIGSDSRAMKVNDSNFTGHIVNDLIFKFGLSYGWIGHDCFFIGFHELDIRKPLTFDIFEKGGFRANIRDGNSRVKTLGYKGDPPDGQLEYEYIQWVDDEIFYDFEDALRSAHYNDTVYLKTHITNFYNEPLNSSKINLHEPINFVINNQRISATVDENGYANIPYTVNFVGEYDYSIELLVKNFNNVGGFDYINISSNNKSSIYKGRTYKIGTKLTNLYNDITVNKTPAPNDGVNLTAYLLNSKNESLTNQPVNFCYSNNGSLIGSTYTDNNGYASIKFNTNTAKERKYDYYIEYEGSQYLDSAKCTGHINILSDDTLNLTLTANKVSDGFKLDIKTWLNKAGKPLVNKIIHLFANNVSIANITTTSTAGTGYYYYKTGDLSRDYVFDAIVDEGQCFSSSYDETRTSLRIPGVSPSSISNLYSVPFGIVANNKIFFIK
jgi:hypothetical protein